MLTALAALTTKFYKMTINKQSIFDCASLGVGFIDKLTLGFFGFVAPKINNSPECELRKIAAVIPKMWLKPKRINGLQLLIDPADWSQTLIFDEVFIRLSYDLRKVPFTPSVIFDCGAHIGLFTLLAKSTFPEASLIAYEPNPNNADFVRKQILKNKLEVVFNESAISTESKELDFVAINSLGGRLKGHEVDGIKVDSAPTYRVKTVDFSVEMKKIRPQSLLLKMDIEGEERSVLPAIMPLLPKQSAIFFETHSGEAGWLEAERLLRSNGFSVEQLTARGLYFDGFACRS
jgi:FkbM family methyltransferase